MRLQVTLQVTLHRHTQHSSFLPAGIKTHKSLRLNDFSWGTTRESVNFQEKCLFQSKRTKGYFSSPVRDLNQYKTSNIQFQFNITEEGDVL